ncbi:hypothetical protein BDN71DRAFT_1507147 [Pleurotus eryngii]|uniref:Uncharacterized protein n=1 Tax=Pleurotus eryngii TaxID=5323 RepID=A0A9P6DGG1_PLEER|nr:hypothetical protein BDN71DRAFT_1507147 [Pleurotus eryngii]
MPHCVETRFLPSPPFNIDTTTLTFIIKMKFTTVMSVLVLLAGFVSAQGPTSFTQPVETTLDEPSATPTFPGGTTAESSEIVDPTVGSSSIDTEVPTTESTDSSVTIQTSLPGTSTSTTSSPRISVTSTPLTTASVSRSTLLPASVTTTSRAPNQSQTGNSAAGMTGNGVAVGAIGLALGLML